MDGKLSRECSTYGWKV